MAEKNEERFLGKKTRPPIRLFKAFPDDKQGVGLTSPFYREMRCNVCA